MSTMDRAKMSKKNQYYLSPHRYRELRHHCLQYPEWKSTYGYLLWPESASIKELFDKGCVVSSVEEAVLMRDLYLRRIQLVEDVVKKVDADIYPWLLRGVTEELPYENLKLRYGLPMSRNAYYKRYRQFFWVLDKVLVAREEQGLY